MLSSGTGKRHIATPYLTYERLGFQFLKLVATSRKQASILGKGEDFRRPKVHAPDMYGNSRSVRR